MITVCILGPFTLDYSSYTPWPIWLIRTAHLENVHRGKQLLCCSAHSTDQIVFSLLFSTSPKCFSAHLGLVVWPCHDYDHCLDMRPAWSMLLQILNDHAMLEHMVSFSWIYRCYIPPRIQICWHRHNKLVYLATEVVYMLKIIWGQSCFIMHDGEPSVFKTHTRRLHQDFAKTIHILVIYIYTVYIFVGLSSCVKHFADFEHQFNGMKNCNYGNVSNHHKNRNILIEQVKNLGFWLACCCNKKNSKKNFNKQVDVQEISFHKESIKKLLQRQN